MLPLNTNSIINTVQNLVSQQSSTYNSIGLKFVYNSNGKTYNGIKTALKKEAVNSSAGLNQEYAFSIITATNIWGNVVPAPKARITINNVIYKILDIETDSINATYRLHLGSEYGSPQH